MGTGSLGAQLWGRVRPSVAAKLDVMQAAAEASSSGEVVKTRRDDAIAAAHKLSGSLGTYGFPTAGERAAAYEQALAAGSAGVEELASLVGRIRELTGLSE